MADVRKELNFCKKVGMRVIGVVENMSGLVVPMASAGQPGGLKLLDSATGADRTAELLAKLQDACPELLQCSLALDVFKTAPSNASGPEAMAGTFGVPFLGSLPLDRDLCAACEGGRPLQGSAVASEALTQIVSKIVAGVE